LATVAAFFRTNVHQVLMRGTVSNHRHVVDYLLSAAVTPGGQSVRRRQQRLPKRQQIFRQKLFSGEFM